MPSLSPRKPWKLFGSCGDPRPRLAYVLVERGAFAEAEPLRRRVLDGVERRLGPEHRETLICVNNLASVLKRLGKFSEAPLVCRAAVTVAGGWCCILWWEELGKIAGKQSTTFSDHLRICHLCRSAIMHEHVNFTQIISNHVIYGRAKPWTCQSLAKDVCKEQMPRCKFQSEMSVKAFLQKKSQNRCTLRLEFICKWKIGTTMAHIQIMLKCQLVELCVLFFKF